MEPQHITSRDNPLLVQLRKLSQDGSAYRKLGQIWLEGEHLCQAAAQRGWPIAQAVLSEAAWHDAALQSLAAHARRVAVVPEALFRSVSALESAAQIGFVAATPEPTALRPDVATLVLDRLQDAGNVGSIVRSAAALGVEQVLALKGSVALWSPKVLRAGMGAHFALQLAEGLDLAALDALRVPLVATSSHAGSWLHEARLPQPCAWIVGHEGQGVDAALQARAALVVRIPQPGGEESLNAAVAAAICLYESARQRAAAGAAQ
jgi:TrmH family RNA methyltransferase